MEGKRGEKERDEDEGTLTDTAREVVLELRRPRDVRELALGQRVADLDCGCHRLVCGACYSADNPSSG